MVIHVYIHSWVLHFLSISLSLSLSLSFSLSLSLSLSLSRSPSLCICVHVIYTHHEAPCWPRRVPNDELLANEVPEVDVILAGHDHHYDVKPVGSLGENHGNMRGDEQ